MNHGAACRAGALVALAAALVLSCASAGGDALSGSGRDVPDWVVSPPGPSSTSEYFVASGSDPDGDVAAAEERAAGMLLTQINQALGVDISFLTVAEARASRDSFAATVTSQVTQASSGRLAGFRIEDRFLVSAEERVTVHVLGAYERSAFEAERREREELIAAQEALYLGPERAADQARSAGDTLEAVRLYLQAGEAASRAPESLRSAAPTVGRTLQAALSELREVDLVALSGPREVEARVRVEEGVVFQLRAADGAGLGGVSVEASVTGPERRSVRRETGRTNSQGLVTVALPRPESAGSIRVSARLETSELDRYLRALPPGTGAARDAIQAELARIGADWELVSTSRAREIAIAPLVLDLRERGEIAGTGQTEAGLSDVLLAAGFPLVASGITERNAVVPDRDALVAAVVSRGLAVDRVIVGTAMISEVSEPDGYLVRVRGEVSVVDLATGELLYATSAIKNARSASLNQAVNVAFYQLGVTLGEELAARMP